MSGESEQKLKIGLIILAAGNSSRLGIPKQSVNFRGQTLLQKIVRESLESDCRPIVVVLGENDKDFVKFLKNFDVQIIKNEDWRQGMGNSLSYGVKILTEIDQDLKGIVVCVCDQPLLTAAKINNLVNEFLSRSSKIVASSYSQTLGVPAIFDQSLFAELTTLRGKSGAKKIIEKFRDETFAVDFPEGQFDIDTQTDLQKLRKIE